MDDALQLFTCVADLSIHEPLHNDVLPEQVVAQSPDEQIWPCVIQLFPFELCVHPQYRLLLAASIQANVELPVLQYVNPVGHEQVPLEHVLPFVHLLFFVPQ